VLDKFGHFADERFHNEIFLFFSAVEKHLFDDKTSVLWLGNLNQVILELLEHGVLVLFVAMLNQALYNTACVVSKDEL
jgi:hypothetical protein